MPRACCTTWLDENQRGSSGRCEISARNKVKPGWIKKHTTKFTKYANGKNLRPCLRSWCLHLRHPSGRTATASTQNVIWILDDIRCRFCKEIEYDWIGIQQLISTSGITTECSCSIPLSSVWIHCLDVCSHCCFLMRLHSGLLILQKGGLSKSALATRYTGWTRVTVYVYYIYIHYKWLSKVNGPWWT